MRARHLETFALDGRDMFRYEPRKPGDDLYEFNGRTEGKTEATYRNGSRSVDAVTANGPGQIDWVAMRNSEVLGFIGDERDSPGWPSPESPADEEATPFAASDRNARYIANTHSLVGALYLLYVRAEKASRVH
jgi:hypothetical protein